MSEPKLILVRPVDLPKSYEAKLFKNKYYIDGSKNALSAIAVIYDGKGNLFGISNTLEVIKKWTSPYTILKKETNFIEGMLAQNETLKHLALKFEVNGFYFNLKYLESALKYVNFKSGQIFAQELIEFVHSQLDSPIDFISCPVIEKNVKAPSPAIPVVEKKRIMVDYNDIIVFPDGKTMTFGQSDEKKRKI